MRAIKFRAWDKTKKMMYQPAWTFEKLDDGPIFQDVKVHGGFSFDEIMQFTGLLDAFGVPIFEGDIIEDKHRQRKEIRWFDDEARFEVWWLDTHFTLDAKAIKAGDYAVIGNIYQNAELLNAQK